MMMRDAEFSNVLDCSSSSLVLVWSDVGVCVNGASVGGDGGGDGGVTINDH